MVILSAAVFVVHYTVHTLKGYNTVQLLFCHDMILPIEHISNWKLIRQSNQAQIIYDNLCKNTSRVYHKFEVRDKVILRNNSVYKYETP